MPKRMVTDQDKIIARYLATAFGGTPHVQEYAHDSEPLAVDILWCDDRPTDNVTSYSTVGLSGFPMKFRDGEYPTRLEIAGACASEAEFFPNVLSTAAFIIMRTGKLCSPGTVMPHCAGEYSTNCRLPHLCFTTPFLWGDALNTLDLGARQVSWLLVMPISQTEYDFLRQHGDTALEHRFEQEQIDIYDLNRASVA